MFGSGFEKIAAEDGWHKVQDLLHEFPKGGKLKVGDRVAYSCEMKWTNEPDGKHTGGGWDESDFSKDGVTIGDIGIVSKLDGKDYKVKWDKHRREHPEWEHRYRTHDLRLLPKKAVKNGF